MKKIICGLFALLTGFSVWAGALLPSWQEGSARRNILDFVSRVTQPGPDYVAPAARIAVFDNDGTLWSEQPMYVQLAFVLDRVRALAPRHPEWKTAQPFRAALEHDMKTLLASGEPGLMKMLIATHAGMSTDAFTCTVTHWLATARHPKYHRPYPELVYQPMLEVIDYLKQNQFKVYIVSGGGVEFMRPWSEAVYGIPPEQVIGSSVKTRYEIKNGKPVLIRLPEINFINDKAGKPVGINQVIGRRPIAAFGNSDGDLQMLQWTTAGSGARFGLLVHHTDNERETAYDRKSAMGKLDQALDLAPKAGWTVVDMKADWKVIFSDRAYPDVSVGNSPRDCAGL